MTREEKIKKKEILFMKLVDAIDSFWYGNVEEDLIINSEVPVTFDNLADGIMEVEIVEDF